uniref:CXXC motif containing zinc binding protein n=1 Tax=Cyprinus carpio TaxID=7962 RepID=A0A8C1TXU9_CYPCA
MGKFGLQFKATLENITNVRPVGDDFRWYLKLKCGNCGEVSDKWQYITLLDSMPLKGGRGSASMVQKCKLCSRENSIDILRDTITPYNAEDSERYKTIVQFECRGLEQVDFQPQAGFAASGAETSTQFPEINLQEKFRKRRNSHIISHLQFIQELITVSFTCFRTGRTTMRRPVSLWGSMRSHINSSSAENEEVIRRVVRGLFITVWVCQGS